MELTDIQISLCQGGAWGVFTVEGGKKEVGREEGPEISIIPFLHTIDSVRGEEQAILT